MSALSYASLNIIDTQTLLSTEAYVFQPIATADAFRAMTEAIELNELSGRLVGLLAVWLAGRLAGWLAGWLAGRPAGWLAGYDAEANAQQR